jgi:hypothetical protein
MPGSQCLGGQFVGIGAVARGKTLGATEHLSPASKSQIDASFQLGTHQISLEWPVT